ncbi:S1 family peptidase [Streptomyces palmae]|uniref:Serine protease n=1 Tax=Streptomyces palmae TaxID=1701085 RepID=A0A4Z0GA94_9ACTN|nr:serine protease [Streptomyces palmae]TGA93157.1 serine protease [Streptomyces palmae]
MPRPLVATSAALLLAAATLAGAGPAMASNHQSEAKQPVAASQRAEAKKTSTPQVKAVSFAGTVALSNCSGSIVRMPNSADTDPAFVMSNGHCLETGMPDPGEVIVDQPSTRSFTVLNSAGSSLGTVRASKIAYATMTDTDVSLYQLSSTYAQIKSRFNIDALSVSPDHPVAGTAIKVVSGYWKKIYSCNADAFVYELHEGGWVWKDSLRYTSSCNTIGGTSGSPVVDATTGKVVAINNTGNESGGTCTMNNPCEVDQSGNVTVRQGINYAQQTYQITKCVATGNKIDLNLPGCVLPRP